MTQNRPRLLIVAGLLAALVTIAGCARSPPPSGDTVVTVYKNPSCGCCNAWVQHLRSAGLSVEAHDVRDLAVIKARVGIPVGMGSCHTAEVGGYFVEGHVPADDIRRLLRERPDAKGLTVPGMPIGSPGMEDRSGKVDPYDVLLVSKDGSTSVYAHHEG